MRNHWTEIEKYLEDQKIAQELIGELRDFHMRYEVENQVKERVEKPDILFYREKDSGNVNSSASSREITCYFPVRKLQGKMYYVRHWHGYSEDQNTTFLFM